MKLTALFLTLMLAAGTARAESVAELVAQIPVKTSAEESALAAKLMAGGEPALKELLSGLVPLGTQGKDDTKTRDAVSALVRYVGRPHGEADRATLVKAISSGLADASDPEVKTFLVNRLQDIGHDDAIAALAPLLSDEALALHAAMALERIGSPAAVDALAKALPRATGKRRIALIKSLGMLRASGAADEIRKSTTDDDHTLRMTALWALASVGDPSASELLNSARQNTKNAYDQSLLYDWALLSATRLADGGKKKEAAAICTAFLGNHYDPVNVQSAAARTLARIEGQGSLETLIPLIEQGNLVFRAAVLDAVAKIPGDKVTPALVERLKSTSEPQLKSELLAALAKRNDASARPAIVVAATKDADPAVRVAALTALVSMGRDEAIPTLVDRIASDNAEVAKPAAEMLGRIPGEKPLAAAADALASASAKSKVNLLELLAARAAHSQSAAVMKQTEDGDAAVRLAALRAADKVAGPQDAGRLVELGVAAKDAGEESAAFKAAVMASSKLPAADRSKALLEALKNAKGPKRGAIERALAKLGGEAALDAVTADLKSPDAAVREGALSALAEWQDPAAIAPLLDAADKSADESQQITAIRGVVQVLKNSTGLSASDKAAAYSKALAGAKRPQEKKMILGALGNERGQAAFDVAAQTLGQPGLEAESALAVIKTAIPQGKGQPGLKGPHVAAALKQAIAHCPDGTLKNDAQRYLNSLEKGK